MKWPVTEKKGDGKRNLSAASSSQKKAPSQSKPASKAQSKVDRLQAALQALGPEESVVKTALVEAINSAKAELPKPVHPQQKVADAAARSFATSWRRRSRCRASESGFEAGKDACTSAPRWRASRFVPPIRGSGQETSCTSRRPSARSKGSLCTDGGEACEREASAQPRHCPEPSTPRQEMEVDPNEEVIRLKAQVAELQLERQVVQEADSSRKKARTVELSLTYVTPVHGGKWWGEPFSCHVEFDRGRRFCFEGSGERSSVRFSRWCLWRNARYGLRGVRVGATMSTAPVASGIRQRRIPSSDSVPTPLHGNRFAVLGEVPEAEVDRPRRRLVLVSRR